MLTDDLIEINRRLSFNLWYLTNVLEKPHGLSPRLILPKRRSGQIRISEQEARFLYCGLLNTLNYYYSVETPTEQVYQQTGQEWGSAASDLSLYVHRVDGFKKIANVEFKAHNPAVGYIRKDIEKLIKEGIIGNWFHTIKNVDRGTFPSLFAKFIDSFKELSGIVSGKEISIIFCFCVIEKRWACIKHFLYDSSSGDFGSYVDDFFRLRYEVKAGKLEVDEETDWYVFQT